MSSLTTIREKKLFSGLKKSKSEHHDVLLVAIIEKKRVNTPFMPGPFELSRVPVKIMLLRTFLDFSAT